MASIANTTIVLRKSGTPGASPSSLANGELALNYADGKLYYKSNTGSILTISGSGGGGGGSSYSFATINANSSLILATSPTDTLSIVPGNNITITANTTSKSIKIDSTAVSSIANTGLNWYDFGSVTDPLIATYFDFGSVTS
jgi:pyruvate/2-oxoglutarate dehydrogenase complex dihydrolipoamide acyltransferase (E2) component